MRDDEAFQHRLTPPDERVRAWVREDFGVELALLDRVELGGDEAARLWHGGGIDGSRYAVKLSGGGTPAGLVMSAYLAQHGVPGIAGPVRARGGRHWSEREGRRLSLTPWLSDERAIAGGMNAEHWTAYGALLAKLHTTEVTGTPAESLPREARTHERLVSFVRAWDHRMHLLADRQPPDPLVRGLVHEWCVASGPVAILLDHTEELGRRLRARHAPTVLCHGDPHLGNLLLGVGGRIWLIDWDDAVLAPPERDLMFIIGGVLAFAPVGPREQRWFFEGYGAPDLDPIRLAYYRCTRALADLVYPATQVIAADRWSERERAYALSLVRGVLSPTGLLRLALSSLHDLGLIPSET